MNHKTTLLQTDDFRLYAQLSPVRSPDGGLALTITSTRLASRNPQEEQVRFFACLEPQGLQALADLIAQGLNQAKGVQA